jgi:putative endonuclease
MAHHNKYGKQAEETAKEYLEEEGYRVLARNYRFDSAEIDLICTDDRINIFVEVKARKNAHFGHPEEAVTDEKERHLLRAATQFIEDNNLKGEYRFDIISITGQGQHKQVRHIRDAFFPVDE